MERWLTEVSRSNGRASLVLAFLSLLLFLPGFFTLPPMDRDEPRFAQASKQMLETGDYVAIRFQDEARNKKPVGIYWFQATVVRTAEAIGMADASGSIWLYRVPSLAGAVGAVLLTYWAALVFVTPRNAFIAAALLAATLLLGVEARLAKTDAVIALTVVAAMGSLARLRMRGSLSACEVAIFWTAIAVGILVKGPITPAIPAFAILALSIQDRSGRWLVPLRPLLGLALCLVVVAPWLILIAFKTNGAFFSDSIGGDMLGKVAGAKENHGAPPLTYMAVFWITAWPMAPFAALAAPFAWRNWRLPRVAFLLAWLIPAWVLFELVPTKLPHYVLPLFPAIAILIGLALENGLLHLDCRWRRAVAMLVPVVALSLAVAAIFASLWFKSALVWQFYLPMVLIVLVAVELFRQIARKSSVNVIGLSLMLALPLAWQAYSTILTTPTFQPFAVSPRLAQARLDATSKCSLAPAATGYREPSLVFLTTTSLLMTDGAGAAAFLNDAPCRIAFVDAAQEPAFTAALSAQVRARLTQRVVGINLNGGKALDIAVYVRQEDAP